MSLNIEEKFNKLLKVKLTYYPAYVINKKIDKMI
jgi:hypothetical protein